jgi:branched-chain amino acid aminotransferase
VAATLASVDGTIGPPESATIGVTDEGLLRGDGVFEVMRLYDGAPFALDEHMVRMAGSAQRLRLDIDIDAIRADMAALLRAAQDDRAGMVRVLVTRGGRRIVLLETLPDLPETLTVQTITYAPTRVLDQIKSLSYGANMLCSRLAREQGADEALLVSPHGRVLEFPTKSFFYVIGDGPLRTPPLDDHILDSITRRHVLAATDARERSLSADELPEVREAFAASTLREVHPVSVIDGRALPAVPGPITQAAAQAVSARVDALLSG